MQEIKESSQKEVEIKEDSSGSKTAIVEIGESKEETLDIKTKESIDIENEPKKKSKKVHKNLDAIAAKVDTIKQDAESIYNEYTKFTKEFEDSSANLAKQENEIIEKTISKTISLFNELGVENLSSMSDKVDEVTLDNKEELLHIKYPSKGRAKGFLYGLFTSVLTFGGLSVYGAKLADLPLTVSTFMQKGNLDTIATKYLNLLNIDKSAIYGYIGVGVVSLLVGFLVYKLTTFMQKFKNEKYINNLQESSVEFKHRLENKIEDLKELLDHLDNIKLVNKKYDVILQEQNAKINRMLFIEQPKTLDDLHKTSKLEVEKTLLIVDELIKLMNTSVSKNDKINSESVANLASANSVINEVIKKLY